MKRPARIALNVLMPPLLATGCFITIFGAAAANTWLSGGPSPKGYDLFEDLAASIVLIAFYAYTLAGVPSLLHAIVMEFAYRKFPADRWSSVFISALSGTIGGLIITDFLGHGLNAGAAVFIVVGCFVGFGLGSIIKWLSRPTPASHAPSLHGCE